MQSLPKLYSVLLLCSVLVNGCGAASTATKVHEVTAALPKFPEIDVSTPDRFLNDLMLSPLWKVEKRRDGSFVAKARSIAPDNFSNEKVREFLFEFMAAPGKALPKDYRIKDGYLPGAGLFSSFQIQVVFSKPDLTRAAVGDSGQQVKLGVYEDYTGKIGPNSTSELIVKLSARHEIYVILREQGADPARSATFAKLLPTCRELAEIAAIVGEYRAEERYAAFYSRFFGIPLKDQEIKRFPGLQDRDTFYGYFRAKPKTSYHGINIKISHPVYCPDEGTRKYSRLEKAEYCGAPYQDKDVVFFLIEDNAVYLSGAYDERFGTFTGKESFDGTLEVLNDAGIVLLTKTDKFKGWQR